jgi:hypothetical protein
MPRSRQPQYVQGRLEGVDWDHYHGSFPFGSSQPKDSYTPALPDHPDRVRGFHVTSGENVASIKRTGLRPSTYTPQQVRDLTFSARYYNRSGVYFDRDEPQTEYGDAIMEMSAHKSRVKKDREFGHELATHGIPPQHVAQVGHISRGVGGASRTHWSTAPAESCIDCNKTRHHENEGARRGYEAWLQRSHGGQGGGAKKQALDPNNTGV